MALTEQQQLNKNINPFLTTYAQGYKQQGLIYSRVIPQVEVLTDSVTYQKNSKDGFKIIDSRRALNANPKVANFNSDIGTATLVEHTLESQLDKQAYKQAERLLTGRGLRLKMSKIKLLSMLMDLEREKAAADLLTTTGNFDSTCRSALTSTDCWSDYTNSNPIKAIKAAREAVRTQSGVLPNKLVLGGVAWQTLKEHPVILDRIKYAQLGVSTLQLVAAILELDEIIVGGAVYSSDAGVNADVWGDVAILMYIPSNLTPETDLEGEPLHSVGFNLIGYPEVQEFDEKMNMCFIQTQKYLQTVVSIYNGFLFTNVIA